MSSALVENAFIFFRVRELTTAKIGTLLRITGQVVRTHPVHPELISGTFLCLDCRTVIKDVEQQFKYTQVCGLHVHSHTCAHAHAYLTRMHTYHQL